MTRSFNRKPQACEYEKRCRSDTCLYCLLNDVNTTWIDKPNSQFRQAFSPNFSHVCRPERANADPAETSVATFRLISRTQCQRRKLRLRCSGKALRPRSGYCEKCGLEPNAGKKGSLRLHFGHFPSRNRRSAQLTNCGAFFTIAVHYPTTHMVLSLDVFAGETTSGSILVQNTL